jgi:hypothetical protein
MLAAPETLPGISPGVYSADDFAAVSAIAHAEAGIVLAEGKAMLVYSRLAPLVRAQTRGLLLERHCLLAPLRRSAARTSCAPLSAPQSGFVLDVYEDEDLSPPPAPRPAAASQVLLRKKLEPEVRWVQPGCSDVFLRRPTGKQFADAPGPQPRCRCICAGDGSVRRHRPGVHDPAASSRDEPVRSVFLLQSSCNCSHSHFAAYAKRCWRRRRMARCRSRRSARCAG